jgi:heme exporter protein B
MSWNDWQCEYHKEKALLCRQGFTQMQNLCFFILFLFMSLFSVNAFLPNPALLVLPLLWLAFMIVLLWDADRIFWPEKQEGLLYYYALQSLEQRHLWIMVRMLMRWLFCISPLLLCGGIAAWVMGVEPLFLAYALLGQFMATPYLLLLAMLGASMVASAPQAGILIALLVFPFYIPILVLAQALSSPTFLAMNAPWGLFMLLAALSLLAIISIPYIIAALLKIGIS